MPTFRGHGDAPIVQFDPSLEVSPFSIFRRLKAGDGPRLVDVRTLDQKATATDRSLAGAERMPSDTWTPDQPDAEVVLFDDNGTRAVDIARRLQQKGYSRVRALFGGLDLYEFSLDPEIVGDDTFLARGEVRGR